MKNKAKVVQLVPRPEGRAADTAQARTRTSDSLRQYADGIESIEEVVGFIRTLPQQWEFLAEQIADRVAEKVGNILGRRLYSIDEVATQLGVCRRTVENLLAAENCPFQSKRIGTRRLITRESVEQFVGGGGGSDGVN